MSRHFYRTRYVPYEVRASAGSTEVLERLASIGEVAKTTVLLDDGEATTQRCLPPGPERRVARPDEAAFRGGCMMAVDTWAEVLGAFARC